MRRALLAVGIIIVTLACLAVILLSVAEKRVIGTWEYTTADATGRMRFYPDHKTAWWFVESSDESIEPKDAVYGTWHIRGIYLVCDMDYGESFKDSAFPPPPAHNKLPLTDFLSPRPKAQYRPYM